MEVKPDIDVVEGKQIIDSKLGSPDFDLIDVRTPEEYRASHIDGSKHIELQDLENHLGGLDKNKYYLVYCRSGKRSDMAAKIMRARGFGKVSNLLGGILAWTARSFPTIIGK